MPRLPSSLPLVALRRTTPHYLALRISNSGCHPVISLPRRADRLRRSRGSGDVLLNTRPATLLHPPVISPALLINCNTFPTYHLSSELDTCTTTCIIYLFFVNYYYFKCKFLISLHTLQFANGPLLLHNLIFIIGVRDFTIFVHISTVRHFSSDEIVDKNMRLAIVKYKWTMEINL